MIPSSTASIIHDAGRRFVRANRNPAAVNTKIGASAIITFMIACSYDCAQKMLIHGVVKKSAIQTAVPNVELLNATPNPQWTYAPKANTHRKAGGANSVKNALTHENCKRKLFMRPVPLAGRL